MAEQEEPKGQEFVEYPRERQPQAFDLSVLNEAWRVWIGNYIPYLVTGGLMIFIGFLASMVMNFIFMPGFTMTSFSWQNMGGFAAGFGATIFLRFIQQFVSTLLLARLWRA